MERDGDVELCTEVEIKEEPESDDDDDDDDYQLRIAEGDTEDEVISSKAHGQTSLDLASNKKDVSLVLMNLLHLCVCMINIFNQIYVQPISSISL